MLQKGWIISLVTVPSPPSLSICKKFIQLNNYHKLYTKHPDVTIDNWGGEKEDYHLAGTKNEGETETGNTISKCSQAENNVTGGIG